MRKFHKFKAQPTKRDGYHFGSKKEARYYDQLLLCQESGTVLGFLRQVPLFFPGNIKYIIDFLVFYADGTCEGIEVKGFETPEWKIKWKLAKQHYPWMELRVVK